MEKIYALPTKPAAVAGRGVAGLIAEIALRASFQPGKFDELAEIMPALIRETTRDSVPRPQYFTGDARVCERVLAGWNHAADRPEAHTFQWSFDDGEVKHDIFAPDELGGHVIMPPPALLSPTLEGTAVAREFRTAMR
jgi:hypothetical protein